MTATTKKQANRKLAAALRARRVTPNGDAWTEAKALVAAGMTPAQAAREVAIVHAAPEPKAKKEAKKDARPKATPKATPVQAQRVKEGKVARDAKGRILPATVSQAPTTKVARDIEVGDFLTDADTPAWRVDKPSDRKGRATRVLVFHGANSLIEMDPQQEVTLRA